PRLAVRAWAVVSYANTPILCKARHDHVIDDRPVVAQQVRVPGAAWRRRDFIRTQAIEEIVGRRAFDEDFSHVAYVEQADRLADGHVFLADARVLEGHLPAADCDA